MSSFLNIAARGLLEQTIDKAIADIPYTVHLYRMEQVKKNMAVLESRGFPSGIYPRWNHTLIRIDIQNR